MNKKFVKKLIQSEILKYEAIKELLPDKTKGLIEELEEEVINQLKELALEIILDKDEPVSAEKIKKVEIV
jgi:hypothetical protein